MKFEPAPFKWAPQILPGPARAQPPAEVCRCAAALRHRLVIRRVPGAGDPQQRAGPLLPAQRAGPRQHGPARRRAGAFHQCLHAARSPWRPTAATIIYGIVAAGTPEEVAAELKQISLPRGRAGAALRGAAGGRGGAGERARGRALPFQPATHGGGGADQRRLPRLYEAALRAALLARQMVGQPLHLGLGLHGHRPGATGRRARH